MPTDRDPLATTELPTDLARGVQQVTGRDARPETLNDAVTAVEELLETRDVEITVDQMYQPDSTRHSVQFGARTEHVPCVLDALIAGLLVEPIPVVIRSKPPNGDRPVEVTVAESAVTAEPSGAVFSWGFAAADVRNPDPDAAVDDAGTVSMATCSYINAFPDEASYRRWADGLSDAVVMHLDLSGMIALAERAAGGWVTVE